MRVPPAAGQELDGQRNGGAQEKGCRDQHQARQDAPGQDVSGSGQGAQGLEGGIGPRQAAQ